MVNICVCGRCSNSSLSGHRVHRFPAPKNPVFRAWVRFVQVKRQDFTSSSVSNNSVICSAHFREEDYNYGDLNEYRMGFRCKNKIRLKSAAVPSIHSRETERKERRKVQDRRGPGAATTTMAASGSRLSGASCHPAARKLEVARMITKVMSQSETAQLHPDTDKEVDGIVGLKHQPTTANHATPCGYRQLISYQFTVVPARVEQMVLIKEEAPEEWRPGVDQLDPEALNIKEEEEEEPLSRLEGEQLNVKEETDVNKFSVTAVTLKSEDDEEEPLLSQLHQHQVEDRDLPSSSSADGEDCGGAETSRNPDLQTHKDHSSSSETELSEDYEDDQDVDYQPNNKNRGIKTGGSFINVQTGDKMFPCGVCGQQFSNKSSLIPHMRIHTRDKPFPCNVCARRFKRKSTLNSHMRIHTGDKPFPCHICGQRFRQKGHVNTHIRIHP